MDLFYNVLFPTLWLAWLVYWLALSRRVKTTSRRESTYSRLSYVIPTLLAAAVLFWPSFPFPPLDKRFLPSSEWLVWGAIGAALNVIGLLFACWARVYLGRNWSGTVTLKENHELIMTGPYGIVRHPIYTGLLTAFIGVAIARAEWRSILGVVIISWAFWRKLRIEERWMREQFGDAYETYSRRVSALVPFIL
jgi:protein-S-isoprenylcysteine O-methyltransferase Ste14